MKSPPHDAVAIMKCDKNGLLGFYTTDVAAIAGVNLHELAFVDEKGHTDFGAGFQCGGLEGVGGGVAFQAGLGIGDFEHSLDGHFGIEDSFGRSVAYYFHSVAFLHKCSAGNEFLVDGNLLKGFIVHENVIATISIEVLEGTTLYAHIFKFFTDIEAALKHAAVNHVFELGAHESVAFTGLNVEELHAEVQAAIHADASAVLNVLSVNHKNM